MLTPNNILYVKQPEETEHNQLLRGVGGTKTKNSNIIPRIITL